MRELVRSEDFSWAWLKDNLDSGIKMLDDLSTRGVIPGVSNEALVDRLHLAVCLCGESLAGRRRGWRPSSTAPPTPDRGTASGPGDIAKAVRPSLRRPTVEIDERCGAMTIATSGPARIGQLAAFTEKRDALAIKTAANSKLAQREAVEDRRRSRRRANGQDPADRTADRVSTSQKVGGLDERIRLKEQDRDLKKRGAVDEAERARNKDNLVLATRKFVAEDLVNLARGTLGILEHDYVARVGTRMAELFMQIVGSDPEFEAGVFTGVHIAGQLRHHRRHPQQRAARSRVRAQWSPHNERSPSHSSGR